MADGTKSWWSRIFGRSIYSLIFGDNLADKNVAASIVAIMLVTTLCYVVVFREQYAYINALANIVFVVIGYYFGSKREIAKKEEDDN